MFEVFLPDAVYENLPRIQVAAALAAAVAPLSPVRWVAVVALVLAAGLTWWRRRRFRRSDPPRLGPARPAARATKPVRPSRSPPRAARRGDCWILPEEAPPAAWRARPPAG